MQTYSNFSPTQFDTRGLSLPDQQHWLVLPVIQTRDSGTLALSNFATALRLLGGESDYCEVHRFGHWGNGWFEIIIIDPGNETAVKTAEEIESKLEDYVLDEDDLSNREHEEYLTAWEHWLPSDFARALGSQFGLSDDTVCWLWAETSTDNIRDLYEELTPSGDYWGDNYMGSRLKAAARKCTRAQLVTFIKSERKRIKAEKTAKELNRETTEVTAK